MTAITSIQATYSPARSAFNWRTTPKSRLPGRDDTDDDLPAAAAATFLRRRNTRLPGIICRRLQITA